MKKQILEILSSCISKANGEGAEEGARYLNDARERVERLSEDPRASMDHMTAMMLCGSELKSVDIRSKALERCIEELQQPPAILAQPTGPGQWWVKFDGKWGSVTVYLICRSHYFMHGGYDWTCSNYDEWSGPILPPVAQPVSEPHFGSVSEIAASETPAPKFTERVLGPDEVPRKGDWRVGYNEDGSEYVRWKLSYDGAHHSSVDCMKIIRRTPRTISDEMEDAGV